MHTIIDEIKKVDPIGWAVLLAAWLVCLYVIPYFVLSGFHTGALNLYLVQPVLWGGALGLAWLGYRRLAGHPRLERQVVTWAVLAGLLQSALAFAAGFFSQFGHSPYGQSFPLVLGNLFFITTLTLGREFGRAYLAELFGKKHTTTALFTLTFLFTIFMIPPGQYGTLDSVNGVFEFAGRMLFPLLAQNLLATYLALLGGPWASLAYMGALGLQEWLPPILPSLPLMIYAGVHTLVPLATLALFNNRLAPADDEEDTQPVNLAKEKTPTAIWLGVVVLAVGLFGFNTGLFGVRPFLLSGYSMNPTYYQGDIIVTQAASFDELKVGDIIRFHQNGKEIVHRIVTIQPQRQVIVTRGDNNNVDDDPLTMQDIDGKMIFVIPKLGWISIVIQRVVYEIGTIL